MVKFLRFLLLPFSLVFGLVVVVRNFLYDRGLLKSCAFDLPVIVVGNLEVGGSGKTPVIEYLIRLLKDRYRIAVLSRGYGRSGSGFIRTGHEAVSEISASLIGDEPYQYFSRFRDITVAVDADRVAAIERLEDDHDLILLDDAFQHRRLKPGFSILVFDYNTLFNPRLLLPAGNYREPFGGRSRADMLLISKAPVLMSDMERERALKRLNPFPGQLVCFSSLMYDSLEALDRKRPLPVIGEETRVLLLTGIARPGPLLARVREITPHVTHLKYPDHHSFTVKNIAKIAEIFKGIGGSERIILTTEKDAARLRANHLKQLVGSLPVFYWPVRVTIQEQDSLLFEERILQYAGKGKRN